MYKKIYPRMIRLLFGMMVVVLYAVYRVHDSSSSAISSVFSKPMCREIHASEMPRILPLKCVRTAKVPNINNSPYMMCIKPLEVDVMISAAFENHGMWEMNEVKLIIGLTQNYPGGTFLDLGANLGTFSAAVAASEYKAVAVDPIDTNLALLQMSASLSRTEQHIRYILNTVSDEFIRLYPWNREPINEGAMMFVTEDEVKSYPAEQIGEPVDSTTFEDILRLIGSGPVILKIDVEGYECKVLTKYMKNPKKTLYIPYIFMEWGRIAQNLAGNCPDLPVLVEGFVESGYSPCNAGDPSIKLKLEDLHGHENVFWVHTDAIEVHV